MVVDKYELIEHYTQKTLRQKKHYFCNSVPQIKNYYKKSYQDKNEKQLMNSVNHILENSTVKGNYEDILINEDLLGRYLPYLRLSEDNRVLYISKEEKENCGFLKSKDRVYNSKIMAKVKYLEEVNKDKVGIFLTLTNPSEYHYYGTNKHSKKLYRNKKCKFNTLGETKDQSYKNLNTIWRYFYQQSKTYLKRGGFNTEIDFVLAFEPHKNQSYHIHALIYLDREQIEKVEEVYEMVKKSYNLQETKFIEVDKEEYGASPTTYILKYILKTFDSKNEDNFYAEMKRTHSNYRLIRTSEFKHTTQEVIDKVYKHLRKTNYDLLIKMKEKGSLYYELEQYILKNIIIETDTVEEQRKKYSSSRILGEIFESDFSNYVEFFGLEEKIYSDLIKDQLKKDSLLDKLEAVEVYKKEVIVKIYYKDTKELIYENENYKEPEEVKELNNSAADGQDRKERYSSEYYSFCFGL